jgi:hypothetical protein
MEPPPSPKTKISQLNIRIRELESIIDQLNLQILNTELKLISETFQPP